MKTKVPLYLQQTIQTGIYKVPINHKFELFGVLWVHLISLSLSIEGPILQPTFYKTRKLSRKPTNVPCMVGKFIGLLNSTNNIGCCTKVLILLSGIRSMLYTCTTHIQFIRYTIQGVPYSCFVYWSYWSYWFFLFVNVCNFVPHCWLCMRELGKYCLLHFQTPFPQLKHSGFELWFREKKVHGI